MKLFKKLDTKIKCSDHQCYDPLYYRNPSNEEFIDLINKNEYNHDEYEILIINNKLNINEIEYDHNSNMYFKINQISQAIS